MGFDKGNERLVSGCSQTLNLPVFVRCSVATRNKSFFLLILVEEGSKTYVLQTVLHVDNVAMFCRKNAFIAHFLQVALTQVSFSNELIPLRKISKISSTL